jgi:hypothetical protein
MARSRRAVSSTDCQSPQIFPVKPPDGITAPPGCRFVEVEVRGDWRRYITWGDGSDSESRAEVDYSWLLGEGPIPPGCSWLSQAWPSNFYPFGISATHLEQWCGLAVSTTQYGEHMSADDGRFGWRTAVRATRLLALSLGITGATCPGEPLPTTREQAHGELLSLRDALLTANTAAWGAEPSANQADATNGEISNGLRDAAKALHLKGNQAAIVEMLCDAGGKVSLADLAIKCGWSAPYTNTWNSTRCKLNRKLNKYGYRLETFDMNAVVKRPPSGAPK